MDSHNEFDKISRKGSTLLYPLPVLLVSVSDGEGQDNLVTIFWTGTVCSTPPFLSISVMKSRYSHHMIEKTGEFVVNVVNEELLRKADFCGVRSGEKIDKWEECELTRIPADQVKAPMVGESPLNLECKVISKTELGSHDMFVAEIVAVHCDRKHLDEKGRPDLSKMNLVAFSNGKFYAMGEEVGSYGFSVLSKKEQEELDLS